MTSIPDITRMIACIEDRALSEAHKLFDDISNMLTDMRRELGRDRQQR